MDHAGGERTIGQAALQWLYLQPQVYSVLPNIYEMEQLDEFAAASEAPALSASDAGRVKELFDANFGLATATTSASQSRQTTASSCRC